MKKDIKKTIFRLFAISCASTTVFEIPYLSWMYYDLMIETWHLTNAQLGTLMTAYGIMSVISYFPGGWLADVVSERILITVSLITTGLLGLLLLLYPPYWALVLIYGLFGISAVLPMWAAMLKATRRLGDSRKQGRLFGFLESGRCLIPMLYSAAVLFVYNRTVTSVGGMNGVLIAYSILVFLSAAIVWVTLKPEPDGAADERHMPAAVKWFEIKAVLKMPGVWILGIIIFSSYLLYTALSYTTPYSTEIYGASIGLAAFISILRTYGIGIVAAVLGGMIVDKIGSTTKVFMGTFILCTIVPAAFFFVPGGKQYLLLVTILMLALAFGVFVQRGIYYAALDEMGIPLKNTGAAIGVAAFVGYGPDAFVYALIGRWLDNNPGITGYHYAFLLMIAVSTLGFIVSIILFFVIKKSKANSLESDNSRRAQ